MDFSLTEMELLNTIFLVSVKHFLWVVNTKPLMPVPQVDIRAATKLPAVQFFSMLPDVIIQKTFD